MHDINVYIIGSTKTISNNVKNILSKLANVKHIDRVHGDTPYEISVNFAKYKDPKTNFGWGRSYRDGHAFTFGTLSHPMEIISGVLFAHMGKHTPLLLTKKDMIPSIVEDYIKSIKPVTPKDIPRPPFMHGFILGNTNYISYATQVIIEDILSIDHKMMDMDNMHHMNNEEIMNHMHYMYHDSDEDREHDHMHHIYHDFSEDHQESHYSNHKINDWCNCKLPHLKFKMVDIDEIIE